MSTGISLFLIAAGAILHYAVTKTVSGVDLQDVGMILMLVGVLGLVISMVMLGAQRSRGGTTTIVQSGHTTPTDSTVIHDGGS